MMMGDKAFVDTNILIRATLLSAPFHNQARREIVKLWDQDVELWVSRQVLREYIANVTRPQTYMQPLSTTQVDDLLRMIQTLFRVADETAPVTAELLGLIQNFPSGGKQIHDANIVATMRVYNIPTLLTLNVDDFKRFTSVIQLMTITP